MFRSKDLSSIYRANKQVVEMTTSLVWNMPSRSWYVHDDKRSYGELCT